MRLRGSFRQLRRRRKETTPDIRRAKRARDRAQPQRNRVHIHETPARPETRQRHHPGRQSDLVARGLQPIPLGRQRNGSHGHQRHKRHIRNNHVRRARRRNTRRFYALERTRSHSAHNRQKNRRCLPAICG